MTKLFVTLALVAGSIAAQADILPHPRPRPPAESEDVKVDKITGAAAEALYESINESEQLAAGLRTGSKFVKVLRAKDGMDQVICEKSIIRMGRPRTTYNCETQSSQTDQKLPVHRVHPVMG